MLKNLNRFEKERGLTRLAEHICYPEPHEQYEEAAWRRKFKQAKLDLQKSFMREMEILESISFEDLLHEGKKLLDVQVIQRYLDKGKPKWQQDQ